MVLVGCTSLSPPPPSVPSIPGPSPQSRTVRFRNESSPAPAPRAQPQGLALPCSQHQEPKGGSNPSGHTWTNKIRYLQTTACSSPVKRREALTPDTAWVDLEAMMPREMSQTQKDRYHVTPLMGPREEPNPQRQKVDGSARGWGGREMSWCFMGTPVWRWW